MGGWASIKWGQNQDTVLVIWQIWALSEKV